MKRGETSRFTVSPDYRAEKEDETMEEFFANTAWQPDKAFVMDITLVKLTKVEDWYGGKTAVMRTLRKGKGRNAYTDSTVYFRCKVEVNGVQTFSNYREDLDDVPVEEQEDFKHMTLEQRAELLKDDTLIKLTLDHYILPSLLQKVIKAMKKNTVVTMTTTLVDEKLRTNFVSDWLNQYEAFKTGDTVKFTISLFGIENTSYFYKNVLADKLAILSRLKNTAGEFFKRGNSKKAAKIY